MLHSSDWVRRLFEGGVHEVFICNFVSMSAFNEDRRLLQGSV